jgi:Flp pilus assembly protein CpaB
MSDASPDDLPPGADSIDRELARGFAQLTPPEDLMNTLLHAAETTHPSTPIWRHSARRALPTLLLLAAAAGVAFVVLARNPTSPVLPEPIEPTAATPLAIPAGMRAVTLPVPPRLVHEEEMANGAVVDLVLLDIDRTVTLLDDVLVLHATPGQLTVACSPDDAEILTLGRERGTIAPMFHDGDQRLVTVPVDPAPIAAGFVQPGTRTDLLATLPVDRQLETVTLVQNVEIRRAHADGRVTLSVRPEQAERLLHATERGPLSLSLRGN